MALAKVIRLNDQVDVIVRKSIDNGTYAISFTFLTEVEEDHLVQTGRSAAYESKAIRDQDFNKVDKTHLETLGKSVEIFKDLI